MYLDCTPNVTLALYTIEDQVFSFRTRASNVRSVQSLDSHCHWVGKTSKASVASVPVTPVTCKQQIILSDFILLRSRVGHSSAKSEYCRW